MRLFACESTRWSTVIRCDCGARFLSWSEAAAHERATHPTSRQARHAVLRASKAGTRA